jgi:hypothetical protein
MSIFSELRPRICSGHITNRSRVPASVLLSCRLCCSMFRRYLFGFQAHLTGYPSSEPHRLGYRAKNRRSSRYSRMPFQFVGRGGLLLKWVYSPLWPMLLHRRSLSRRFGSCAHFGQTKPGMFSTMPRTRIPASRQKSISLRTSSNKTPYGVVTTTAPSTPLSFKKEFTLKCSSLVPSGVSTSNKSNSPHSTSFKNCFIRPFFFGPL